MIDKKEITVIIRSAGERTLDACYKLLNSIFSKQQIHIIEEVPFSKAVLRSLEIGIEEKRPWLFCVDADVLVQDKGVLKLLEYASNAPQEVFEVQGLILDKFFPVRRPAGNHLYRTKYAEKALKMTPKEGTTLRPEASLLKNMALAGYPWLQTDVIVGIHDFEQNFRDIFRKCFLHGRKHRAWISYVIDYWFAQSLIDDDFRVALAGLLHGMARNNSIALTRDALKDEERKTLKLLNIKEKEDLGNLNFNVEQKIKFYDSSKFHEFQNFIYPEEELNKVNFMKEPNKYSFSYLINKCGYLVMKIGGKLIQLSGRN